MLRALIAILLCSMVPVSVSAVRATQDQGVVGAVARIAPSPELRQEIFEKVWGTVKEKHFDIGFGGVDWDQVKQKYEPQLQLVRTSNELHALLRRMLGELGQSHFTIIPPDTVLDNLAEGRAAEGEIGVELDLVEGELVITRVKDGSAAARAGLRPGFIVKEIDEQSMAALSERIQKIAATPQKLRTYMARAVMNRLKGPTGTAVTISYINERNALSRASMIRDSRSLEMSAPLGNFPAQYVEFESARLNDGIGYIRFNMFVISQMDKIRSAIRSMADARGIIIDLRGNPGGVSGMANGIAGLLEERQTSLGTMRMRRGHINFAVFPQQNPYRGPLVLLMDANSASTSEIFAAGLQENGRATVVGERSMGAALPSVFEKLPDGALFQYAIADFRTPKGILVEGRGVKPDVEISLDRLSLLKGRDLQLEAAVDQVRKIAGLVQEKSER